MKVSTLIFAICCFICLSQCTSKVLKVATEQHREKVLAEHLADERSPIKADNLADLRYFDPSEKYIFDCDCEWIRDGEEINVPTSSGKIKQFQRVAKLSCDNQQKQFELTVYQNLKLIRIPEYKDYLFLPFTDNSNDEETYGGGRYIDLKRQEIMENKYTLDFNTCYNPWCAYSDGYNCPIPPTENHLNFKVLAGEKMYAGERKH